MWQRNLKVLNFRNMTKSSSVMAAIWLFRFLFVKFYGIIMNLSFKCFSSPFSDLQRCEFRRQVVELISWIDLTRSIVNRCCSYRCRWGGHCGGRSPRFTFHNENKSFAVLVEEKSRRSWGDKKKQNDFNQIHIQIVTYAYEARCDALNIRLMKAKYLVELVKWAVKHFSIRLAQFRGAWTEFILSP